MSTLSDSGPLIYLAAVGHFDLLRLYFSELVIPTPVYREVLDAQKQRFGSRETATGLRTGWISVADLQDETRIAPLVEQGMTHTDAYLLALALERQTDFLLSDDLDVRTRALSLGLQVIGTLGILIDGKRDGRIGDLRSVLDRLIQLGFYLNPNGPLYGEVLRLADEV